MKIEKKDDRTEYEKNAAFVSAISPCACGKAGRFIAFGALSFCSNRCLRAVNRSIGQRRPTLSPDAHLLQTIHAGCDGFETKKTPLIIRRAVKKTRTISIS